MVKEYYYDKSDSPDIWSNDDLNDVAFEAWSESDDIEGEGQEEPSKGDVITIYRGESDPITHKEISQSFDLRESIEEKLYELAGEAAEMTTIGDDLQSEFEIWLSENVEINTCRIINIRPLDVTYDGTSWIHS